MNFCDFYKKYKDIILYIIFGVATTVVNFAAYTVFIKVLSFEMTVSNLLSWLIAVSFAFITNKIYVFSSRSLKFQVVLKELLSFYSARIITGIIEIILPTLLFNIGLNFDLFGIKGFVSKAVVSIVIIILNYIFSKLFVFKHK